MKELNMENKSNNQLENLKKSDIKTIERIENASDETVRKRKKNFENISKQDKYLIDGTIQYDEFLENKRKEDGYETLINFKSDKTVDKLIELGIFKENSKGVFLAEPFWHGVLNFIDKSKISFPYGKTINKLKKRAIKLANAADIISPIEKRETLAEEVSLFVGSEKSLIFSKTPSIFNPYENEEYYNNCTKNFMRSIEDTGLTTYYIWNENAVAEQINQNLLGWSRSKDELIQKYFEWFKIFAKNYKLKIYWGDNSKFTKKEFSMPYISDNQMIIGLRENEKLNRGLRVNINGLKGLLAPIPIIGKISSMPPEISNLILQFPSFSNLRNSLLETYKFETRNLTNEIEIIRFIEDWFVKAEKLDKREITKR